MGDIRTGGTPGEAGMDPPETRLDREAIQLLSARRSGSEPAERPLAAAQQHCRPAIVDQHVADRAQQGATELACFEQPPASGSFDLPA